MPELVRQLSGFVHYSEGRALIGSLGRRLLRSEDNGRSSIVVGHIEPGLLGCLATAWRPVSRLLRWRIFHAWPIDDGSVLVFGFGRVFVVGSGGGKIAMRDGAKIRGHRPLAVCRTGGGEFYFGEYFPNADRRPVRVLRSGDGGGSWSAAWEFRGIRHVHGVFWDPYSDWIWVTTGDEDSECAIWVTRDCFETLDSIVQGGQQSRAVQLLFTSDAVYYGSDTPFEVNHLYRLPRDSRQPVKLRPVGESIFFGCKVGDRLFFSTACEPSRVNRARQAVVWTSGDGVDWEPWLRFEKDAWPARLFGYGQVAFPAGCGSPGTVWLTPIATESGQTSLCYLSR